MWYMTSAQNLRRQLNGNKVKSSVLTGLKRWGILLPVIFMFVASGYLGAQQPVETSEGWFIYHEIKKGETLNKISRDYQVPLEKIVLYNPGADKVIKAGEKLRIPVKAPAQPFVSEKGTSSSEKSSVQHIVKKGETLFAIARQYSISLSALLAANPGLTENIREGQVILIPLPAASTSQASKNATNSFTEKNMSVKNNGPEKPADQIAEPSSSNPALTSAGIRKEDDEDDDPDDGMNSQLSVVSSPKSCTPRPVSGAFKVAVLLPFDGEAQDTALRHTRIAWQFYCGIQAAAALHVPRSTQLDVHLYDTGPSTAISQVQSLLNSGVLHDAHVIIGPLYAASFRPVAEYAAARNIPIINPFGKSSVLPGEQPQIRMTPSQPTLVDNLARFLALRYQFGRVIFVNGAPGRDTSFFRQLAKATEEALARIRPTAKNFYLVNSISEVVPLLDATSENLVYYPSTRETAVNGFLNSLRNLQKNVPLTVLGDESWLYFTTADMDFFSKVRLRLPVQSFTARGDTLFDRFYAFCQKELRTEPDFYAFRAFDILSFVVDMLDTYGHISPECLEKESRRYLLAPIRLKTVPGTSVLENTGIALLTLMHNDLFVETFGD